MIRSLTAIVAAVFMFVAVFFLCSIFLSPHLPEFLQINVQLGHLSTNNIVGLILGSLAAASSFFATLRMKK